MTYQDRIIFKEFMQEIKPKFKKGDTLKYKSKKYIVNNIVLSLENNLSYELSYTYTNYRKEVIQKNDYIDTKTIDRLAKQVN